MIEIEQGQYLSYRQSGFFPLNYRQHFLVVPEVLLNGLHVSLSSLLPIKCVFHFNGLLCDISVPTPRSVEYCVYVPALARQRFQSVGLGLPKGLSGRIGDAIHATGQKGRNWHPFNGPRSAAFTVLFSVACGNEGTFHRLIEQLLGVCVLGTPNKQTGSSEQAKQLGWGQSRQRTGQLLNSGMAF